MAASLEAWEARLPPVPKPVANYALFRRAGRIAYTAGIVPIVEGRLQAEGHVGGDLSVEEGYEAARTSALLALSILRDHLGGLREIAQVLQARVFVASAPAFHEQSKVADGATDLLVEVLGESGRPTRLAVGVAELPLGAPVELSLTVETRS